MISDKYKAIFLHVPKVAGSSIEASLKGYLPGRRYFYIKNNKKVKYLINKQHALPFEAKVLYKTKWNNYFKFTFVRNPWSRFVSLYFHLGKNNLISKKLSFTEFIEKYYNKSINLKPKHYNMGLPNSEWTEDVDYVGRIENINEDYILICKFLNKPIKKLKHILRTKHKHYSYYYNRKTKKLIEDIYKEDIKNFNYGFEYD